jgi:hypothetical protein
MDPAAKSPVSFLVHVARLPRKGMPVTIEADPRQRAALAREHGLAEVKSWHAGLLVEPWKRNGVKVSGRVVADIVQECVITLDPLESRIDEAVEGLFLPEDSKLGRLGFDGAGEILIAAEGPDSPETFSGDSIDVGALAEEFFALAIDPYPRKKGAEITPAGPAEDDGEADGPLQRKLRALRDKL